MVVGLRLFSRCLRRRVWRFQCLLSTTTSSVANCLLVGYSVLCSAVLKHPCVLYYRPTSRRTDSCDRLALLELNLWLLLAHGTVGAAEETRVDSSTMKHGLEVKYGEGPGRISSFSSVSLLLPLLCYPPFTSRVSSCNIKNYHRPKFKLANSSTCLSTMRITKSSARPCPRQHYTRNGRITHVKSVEVLHRLLSLLDLYLLLPEFRSLDSVFQRLAYIMLGRSVRLLRSIFRHKARPITPEREM